jgi:hypothetical protein
MQKIAQRRGVLNRLREVVNAPLGGAAEKFFNPQFNEVIEKMREIDSNARSIVVGKSLEGGEPGPDPISFKDILKSAKSNLNRREFMASVADLSRFHKRIALLLAELNKFDSKVDEIHHQFLVKDVGDEHLDEIKGLKNRWAASRQQEDQMLKEAGAIADFLKSWSDPRGRALRFYEKRYEKRVKPLKNGIIAAIRDSEKLFSRIIMSLKDMATARATRNPDKYSDGISKIKGAYNVYDTTFRKFYNDSIKPISEKLIPEQSAGVDQKPAAQEVSNEEIDNRNVDPNSSSPALPAGASTTYVPTGESLPPTYKPTGETIPGVSSIPKDRSGEFGYDIEDYMNKVRHNQQIGFAPTTPVENIPKPDLKLNVTPTTPGVAPPANVPKTQTMAYEPNIVPPPRVPVLAHQNFYNSLQSMANEHPYILANYINIYAKSIQQHDYTTAIQLFKIAKSIKDNHG